MWLIQGVPFKILHVQNQHLKLNTIMAKNDECSEITTVVSAMNVNWAQNEKLKKNSWNTL